jgi:hypothetical protein
MRASHLLDGKAARRAAPAMASRKAAVSSVRVVRGALVLVMSLE